MEIICRIPHHLKELVLMLFERRRFVAARKIRHRHMIFIGDYFKRAHKVSVFYLLYKRNSVSAYSATKTMIRLRVFIQTK